MQKRILRTTALLLCFCILLLAVPNTFAKNEKKGSRFESSKSRFLFVNPGELMTNVLFFLAPHFNHQTDRTSTPPPTENTQKVMKKLTGGMSKSHASTGD
jgi:hypothetical protein